MNRTDVKEDRKQQACPNATLIGYGKGTARFGDFVIFNDGSDCKRQTFGRVAGRATVRNATAEDHGATYLIVIALGEDHSHVSERFVAPADVDQIISPEDFRIDSLLFLLDPSFLKETVATLRAVYSEGWATPNKYRAWLESTGQSAKRFTE